MSNLLKYADEMWLSGSKGRHPWRSLNTLEKITDGLWFASSFANMTLIDAGSELLVIDPGATNNEEKKFHQIRHQFPNIPVKGIVITHGHHDHCFGVERYIDESKDKGWPSPEIFAHKAIDQRFERYNKTAGFNTIINSRQFRGGENVGSWEKDYIFPTQHISEPTSISVGRMQLDLYPDRGETDDAIWIHIPDLEAICTGDLFVWTVPNAGNPQKVQRYAGDWAQALLKMNDLQSSFLLPGHGPPIIGKVRVKDALESTAEYLMSLEEQTLNLMNNGASLDEILLKAKPPQNLSAKHFLRPVYDEPEFIIRNIWRLYGGWYDGQPSNLKPPAEASIAKEISSLIPGGTDKLTQRSLELAGQGEWRLACKLVDMAYQSDSSNLKIKTARGQIYAQRAKHETSTMSIGIFNSTAREMGIKPDSNNTFSVQENKHKNS
ncbi:MAG: alkyl sulfatase dimerization domain-containing protein [Dehalococcoidia bacterium]